MKCQLLMMFPGLEKLIESGEVNPEEVVAVLGKTEGNGCVNDFTRGFSPGPTRTCWPAI